METKTLIPTLLALTIRISVNCQTPTEAKHHILPVLGGPKEISASLTKKQNQNQNVEKANAVIADREKIQVKNYPVLISEEKAEPQTTVKSEINASSAYAISLMLESNRLDSMEMAIITQARSKQGNEKASLLNTAAGYKKQSTQKQILASEINGKLNREKFKLNEIVFNNMQITTLVSEYMIDEARDIHAEAKRHLKLATEMREEAYATHNEGARLGEMNNAEEKELHALGKQDAAIGLLKGTAAVFAMTDYY